MKIANLRDLFLNVSPKLQKLTHITFFNFLGKSSIFKTIYGKYSDLLNLEERSEHERLGAQVFLEAAKKGFGGSLEAESKITNNYSFDICFDFGVPIGAGLGSSASFSSVASGAIYTTLKYLSLKDIPQEITIERKDLEIVKDLTNFGEKLVHGNPSGIDSFVINEGGIVKFTKTKEGIKWENDLKMPEKLDFDIIFTGVNRSTKTSLINMKNLKNAFPGNFDSLISFIYHLI